MSGATFIRVAKAHDDHPCNIERIKAINAAYIVDWVQGDKPILSDLYGLSTDLVLRIQSDGQNGYIQNLRAFGGHLLDIDRNPAISGYQMEGTTFVGLNGIQGTGTYQNAKPNRPSIYLKCGLAIRFLATLIDQVTGSCGILLEGTPANPIGDITWHGTWVGAATPATANVPMIAAHGYVYDTQFYGGEVNGSANYGAEIIGPVGANADSIGFDGFKFIGNALGDYVVKPIAQHQFDAFVSIVFNIGPGGFQGSTLLRKFMAGDPKGCADAILLWKKPAEIIPRRQAEADQFLTPYAKALPKARRTDRVPIAAPAVAKPAPPQPPDSLAPMTASKPALTGGLFSAPVPIPAAPGFWSRLHTALSRKAA